MFATMFTVSQCCNLFLGKRSDFGPHQLRIMPDLIYLRTAFGAIVSNEFYLMFEFFCPLSATNSSRPLSVCYKENEDIKKRKYDERIREVEHSSFSPLVFSSSGGCAPVASLFIKKLSLLHSEKFNTPYSNTINFIRCQYSFSIVRSAIRCLRGSRSPYRHATIDSLDSLRAASDAKLNV